MQVAFLKLALAVLGLRMAFWPEKVERDRSLITHKSARIIRQGAGFVGRFFANITTRISILFLVNQRDQLNPYSS